MVASAEFDVKQVILVNGPFGPSEVKKIREAVAKEHSSFGLLRDAVNELQTKEEQTPASMVRLGVALYLLGRYFRACEILKQADGGAMAHFYLAKSYFARGSYAEASESYSSAEKAGYEAGQCALGRAEALRYSDKPQEALHVLDNLFGPVEHTADYLYQRGATVAAVGGNPQETIALYERAVEADRGHAARSLGWPWKTIATATTRRPWSSIVGRPPRFPRTSGRW